MPPLSTDAVILAFGDSLTFGTGAGEQQSYPEVLAGLTGRKVVNAGVPGEVSKDGLERLPGVLEEVRPDLLILCHGGNDMLRRQDQQQLRDNLVNMLKMARDQGIAVLMVAVPEPGLALKPPALYQELAKEFAIPLEKEVIVSILKKSELKSDQVHPNAAGYQRMAEAFADLLRKSGALL
ncbi:MAG: arylesterase [bacterium]|nr:arylesterase [bacterium]